MAKGSKDKGGTVSLNNHISRSKSKTRTDNTTCNNKSSESVVDDGTIVTKTTVTSRRSLDGSTRTRTKQRTTRTRSKSADRGRQRRSRSRTSKKDIDNAPRRRRSKSASSSLVRSLKRSLSAHSLRRSTRSSTRSDNSPSPEKKEKKRSLSASLHLRRRSTRTSASVSESTSTEHARTTRAKAYRDDASFEVAVKRCIPSEFVLLASQDELSQSQEDYYATDNFRMPKLPGKMKGKTGSVATCAFLEMLYKDPHKFILPTKENEVSCHDVLQHIPKRIKEATKNLSRAVKPTISSSRPLVLGPPSSRKGNLGNFAPFTLVPRGHETGVLRALLIGVITGTSKSNAKLLQGPPNDIAQMKHFLTKHAGFLPANVTVLLEGTTTGSTKAPTKANILKAFATLASQSKAKDVCFIQFSGHGGQSADNYNVHICPSDFMKKGVIRDEDIMKHLIKAMPEKVHSTMLVDCCFSGSVCDLPYILKTSASAQEIETWFDTDTHREILDRERAEEFRGVPGGDPHADRRRSSDSSKDTTVVRDKTGKRCSSSSIKTAPSSGSSIKTAPTLDTSTSICEMSDSLGSSGQSRGVRRTSTDGIASNRRPHTSSSTGKVKLGDGSSSSRRTLGWKSLNEYMSDTKPPSQNKSFIKRSLSFKSAASGDSKASSRIGSIKSSVTWKRVSSLKKNTSGSINTSKTDDVSTSSTRTRRRTLRRSLSWTSAPSILKRMNKSTGSINTTTARDDDSARRSSRRRTKGRSLSRSIRKRMNKSTGSINTTTARDDDSARRSSRFSRSLRRLPSSKSSSSRKNADKNTKTSGDDVSTISGRSLSESISWKSPTSRKSTNKTACKKMNESGNSVFADGSSNQKSKSKERRISFSLPPSASRKRSSKSTTSSKKSIAEDVPSPKSRDSKKIVVLKKEVEAKSQKILSQEIEVRAKAKKIEVMEKELKALKNKAKQAAAEDITSLESRDYQTGSPSSSKATKVVTTEKEKVARKAKKRRDSKKGASSSSSNDAKKIAELEIA